MPQSSGFVKKKSFDSFVKKLLFFQPVGSSISGLALPSLLLSREMIEEMEKRVRPAAQLTYTGVVDIGGLTSNRT